MSNPVIEKDKDIKFPHFIVLKASAGSGKTHALTKRYVQFLLSDKIDKNSLKNILAVTFSNNAAKEMKERILLWLKSLYLNEPGKMKEIAEIISLNSNEIKAKTSMIIDSILDDYSEFQIKTLDSFMSTVFKSSAIDFGYDPDFDILLDSDNIMEEAYRHFLRKAKINTEEGELLKEVVHLMLGNKGKSSSYMWEPAKSILDEVKKIYKKLSSLGNDILISDYSEEENKLKNRISKQIQYIDDLIEKNDLERNRNSSFKSILENVKKRAFPDLIGRGIKTLPIKKLKKKDLHKQRDFECVSDEWHRLKDLISSYAKLYALSYYNPFLSFHFSFKETLVKIKKVEGKIFIEDINKMLSNYMDSQLVPDVYFRMGSKVSHYLIDEFQDTSPLQWANLFPLIDNSLSEGGSLFVVGDTKQSIYGFRDADYRIMKQFEDKSPFLSTGQTVKELDFNYRSLKKIIDFNEKVFKEELPPLYLEAAQKSGLNDYCQYPKDKDVDPGYVEVSIVDKSDELAEREKILTIINELKERGYSYDDIAILAMKNEIVINIASWLNEAKIPFVSHSSLDIRKRKITLEIISLLHFLNSPLDDLSFTAFCLGDMFFRALNKYGDISASKDELHSFFFNNRDNSPIYKSFKSTYPGIWEKLFDDLFKSAGYLPTYDLVNKIFNIFMVFETFEEKATLIKALEVIKDFEDRGENNLKDFLDYSEEKGAEGKWNISIPEGVEAVNLMTVHKAKGLGFPVVINLLYSEKLDKKTGYIIEEKDNKASLLKITQNVIKSNSDFEPLYHENRIRERVNRLNSLYVGFTRPKYELYIVGVKGKEAFPLDLLPADKFKASSKPKPVIEKTTKHNNCISTYHHDKPIEYPINKGSLTHVEEKKRGEFIHRILSHIEYISFENKETLEKDIEIIIKKVNYETGENRSSKELKKTIFNFLQNKKIKKYFQKLPGRIVKNEREFSDKKGRLLRMDRVIIDKDSIRVIDFKTGYEATGGNKHKNQLTNYMKVLNGIYTDKNINGIIAFVDLLKFEESEMMIQ